MPQNHPTGFSQNPGTQKTSKKGGRQPKQEQMHLPPEEEEKRKQRRARNTKEAAARSRKRRLDHMTLLADQVSDLQDTQNALERDIDQLTKEKQELEFVLKTHEPVCRLRGTGQLSQHHRSSQPPPSKKMAMHHQQPGITVSSNNNSKSFLPPPPTMMAVIKSEDAAAAMDCDDKMALDPPLSSAPLGSKHLKFSSNTTTATRSSSSILGVSWSTSPSSITRPDTLHFRSANDLDSPGIPIQTPSKIFAYDSMNGLTTPTGLTPSTSGLTPILLLANAAALLETPTTSVLSSLDGSSGGAALQKALHSL